MIATAGRGSTDPESIFGALEVGADYLKLQRLTAEPFLSQAHGNRWVHVYVNAVGADAYRKSEEVPIGTVLVKTSWFDDGGKTSKVAGPIYVMEKRGPGYFPEHADWFYAMHWPDPPKRFGGPIYWRGKSPRVQFCYEGCHDNYNHELGGLVPSSLLPR